MRYFCFLAVVACGGDSGPTLIDPVANGEIDIHHMDLSINTGEKRGSATLFVTNEMPGLSLEVGDLQIASVSMDGTEVPHQRDGEQLHLGLSGGSGENEIRVEYVYETHGMFDGADQNFSFIWPYFCGNAFPCVSEPKDGTTFSLDIVSSQMAVFPESVDAEAPSYMVAWALGNYTYENLGTSTGGTEVGIYYRAGEGEDMQAGAANLVDSFSWLEETLGDYLFGGKVASVSVSWGPGAFGGMEHHPYWHISSDSITDEETHVHEAAHGWFGNGIRIACWEDFVLSEGVVTYLSMRALEEVGGPNLWTDLESRLVWSQGDVAWPEGCGQIDILNDGLYTDAPYTKGALFLRSVEEAVGREVLDGVLRQFYETHQGKAARMQDLVDAISNTGWSAQACAEAWLRGPNTNNTDSACSA